MATVIARTTCRVAGTGHRAVVTKGKTYDDTDPVVKANPSLFAPADEYAEQESRPTNTAELGSRSMSARNRKKATVEQATAAPGEQRDVTYECDECDEYTGTSERGLKAHKTKMHS